MSQFAVAHQTLITTLYLVAATASTGGSLCVVLDVRAFLARQRSFRQQRMERDSKKFLDELLPALYLPRVRLPEWAGGEAPMQQQAIVDLLDVYACGSPEQIRAAGPLREAHSW